MSASGDDRDGYEAIRRRLLERGYLDGRIERFVLRDLGRPGPATLAMARTAAKAALVGAAPVGAVIALGAMASHGAETRLSDLPLLWVYGSVVALFGLGLLSLLVAIPVVGLARRAPRGWHPTVAGLIAGGAVLVYLVLLWTDDGLTPAAARSVSAGLAWLGATVLVVWLVRLVTVAGIAGHTGEVPRRRRRTLVLVLLTLGPVALALLSARAASQRPVAAFEPFADPGRTLVVAVDGAGRGLVPRPDSPSARWTIDDAARRSPPEVWTTAMTGVPPAIHGVHAVDAQRLPGVRTPLALDRGLLPVRGALRLLWPGRTVPVSGAHRAPRTVWEIVALRRKVAAVGWWSSWPAWLDGGSRGVPAGYVVGDRVLAKLMAGAPADRDTWPDSLFARLAGEFDADRRSVLADRAFDASARAVVEDSRLIDGWSWRVMRRLWSDPSVRAGFVYLPGLDILRHRLVTGSELAGDGELTRSRLIASYVGWLERVLDEAATLEGVDRLIVVSLPGRAAGGDTLGEVVVRPAPGGRSCGGGTLRPLDLAPLLLLLAGFPASAEMPGDPGRACLGEGGAAERIESYGRRRLPADTAGDEWDRDQLRRLRSLGYLD